MNSLTRRTFLKTPLSPPPALALLRRARGARCAGANGDVRVAVIGLNGRGKNHLTSLSKVKGVRVVALCDVDTAVLAKAAAVASAPA